jgi:hypothetical protein
MTNYILFSIVLMFWVYLCYITWKDKDTTIIEYNDEFRLWELKKNGIVIFSHTFYSEVEKFKNTLI